tara:strand:+ start:2423 stop:2647 length:225 start_codon:yes stop_codon:yes gene_type:complete
VEADHVVDAIREPSLLDVLACVAKICNLNIARVVCPNLYAVPIRKRVDLLSFLFRVGNDYTGYNGAFSLILFLL